MCKVRGPVISATPEDSLSPHFSDIWYHQSYARHFSIPSGSVVPSGHRSELGRNSACLALFISHSLPSILPVKCNDVACYLVFRTSTLC